MKTERNGPIFPISFVCTGDDETVIIAIDRDSIVPSVANLPENETRTSLNPKT